MSTMVATQEFAVLLWQRVFFKLLEGDISGEHKPEITLSPPMHWKKVIRRDEDLGVHARKRKWWT